MFTIIYSDNGDSRTVDADSYLEDGSLIDFYREGEIIASIRLDLVRSIVDVNAEIMPAPRQAD